MRWKPRLIGLAILLLLGLFMNIRVSRYSEVVWEGQLKRLICIGKIIDIDTDENVDQRVTLRILSGPFRGRTVTSNNIFTGRIYADRVFHRGDSFFLDIVMKRDGEIGRVELRSYFRNRFLLNLTLAFLALLILVGGATGIQAIISLGITGLLVFAVFVPLAIRGYPPIPIALFVAAIDTILTFIIVGGWHRKIIAGTLGTLGGLTACGLLATLAAGWLHLSGLDVTFGQMKLGVKVWALGIDRGAHWDYREILVAGMILGACGAMMDVGMAISAGVEEVRLAHPGISARQAIRSGFNIGRDVMGTMANTLVFAYVGADMTLALLPGVEYPGLGYVRPFFRLLNQDGPASVALYAIMGTLGLVLSVPMTAVIAGLLATTHRRQTHD